MANLPETSGVTYPELRQIENGERQAGGAGGLWNEHAKGMVERTNNLRRRIDDLTTRAAMEVTVGGGGQFATMTAALSYMSDRRQAFVSGGVGATMRLLTGFVMREQILVRGVQMSWINVVADDPQVTLDRTYLTTQFSGAYPAFAAVEAGSIPTLTALFAMSAGGIAAGRHGILLSSGSFGRTRLGGGVKSAGDCGAIISASASLDAASGNFSGAGETGCRIETLGSAHLNFADLSLCKTGIMALSGARVSAVGAIATQHAVNGVVAQQGATVVANNISARRAGADLAVDLVVATGATISAGGSTGGTSHAVNTLTASGVIYK